jgi:hypothetical protein
MKGIGTQNTTANSSIFHFFIIIRLYRPVPIYLFFGRELRPSGAINLVENRKRGGFYDFEIFHFPNFHQFCHEKCIDDLCNHQYLRIAITI